MCKSLSSPSESGRSAVPSVRPAAVIFINFQIRIRFGEREGVLLLSVWSLWSILTLLSFSFSWEGRDGVWFFSIVDILDQTLRLPHPNKRTHHLHRGWQVNEYVMHDGQIWEMDLKRNLYNLNFNNSNSRRPVFKEIPTGSLLSSKILFSFHWWQVFVDYAMNAVI